jgi:hypothetical protein
MPRITITLVLIALAATSCGKSEARKRQEVKDCGAISLDAPGISRCLVAQFRWDSATAQRAGVARQRELDSIAAFQRDSAWALDAKRHHQELAQCAARGGDVARCLGDNYGWDDRRAAATFDSLWQRDAAKHRDAVRFCERQKRKANMASCLMLQYQWDSKHALALQDSIERAKIRALQNR